MGRYVAYGFNAMYDMKEEGSYIGNSDDLYAATELGAEGPYCCFGVFDTITGKWIQT